MQALVCDMHDGLVPAVGHAEVKVDGEQRSLDLCAEHMAPLIALLASAKKALPVRRASSPRPGPAAPRQPAGHPPADRRVAGSRRALSAERERLRTWAKERGLEVADRGRIPQPVVAAYAAATAASGTTVDGASPGRG